VKLLSISELDGHTDRWAEDAGIGARHLRGWGQYAVDRGSSMLKCDFER
jgi:hypothetical protein